MNTQFAGNSQKMGLSKPRGLCPSFQLGRAILLVAVGLALVPRAARACAACYGQSDAPMARGMNWGIFSMLVMIVLVLCGVAGFFVFLARKSAALSATPTFAEPLRPSAATAD